MLLLQRWAWEQIKTLSPVNKSLTPENIVTGHGFPIAKKFILIYEFTYTNEI